MAGVNISSRGQAGYGVRRHGSFAGKALTVTVLATLAAVSAEDGVVTRVSVAQSAVTVASIEDGAVTSVTMTEWPT